ncbi:unnamed protein product [Protopolystoma xenopodis]|uniref:PDZ domain-containing protein n=1 Tax=Protopolystoma xenopodis TaxID=117903 RepID=A0A3S5ADV6_9PLAT|nr:unnamed protein product [Protopolystoma xenopodis]
MVSGCEAARDGRLMKDDRILAINGVDLTNGSKDLAADLIQVRDGAKRQMVGWMKAVLEIRNY